MTDKEVITQLRNIKQYLKDYGLDALDIAIGLIEEKNAHSDVDCVSVIRCANCQHRDMSANTTSTVICKWLNNMTMPKDGYCSYGIME